MASFCNIHENLSEYFHSCTMQLDLSFLCRYRKFLFIFWGNHLFEFASLTIFTDRGVGQDYHVTCFWCGESWLYLYDRLVLFVCIYHHTLPLKAVRNQSLYLTRIHHILYFQPHLDIDLERLHHLQVYVC